MRPLRTNSYSDSSRLLPVVEGIKRRTRHHRSRRQGRRASRPRLAGRRGTSSSSTSTITRYLSFEFGASSPPPPPNRPPWGISPPVHSASSRKGLLFLRGSYVCRRVLLVVGMAALADGNAADRGARLTKAGAPSLGASLALRRRNLGRIVNTAAAALVSCAMQPSRDTPEVQAAIGPHFEPGRWRRLLFFLIPRLL